VQHDPADADAPRAGARSALVLGASGLVGAALLARLLDDPRYTAVRVLARRALPQRHPNLSVEIVDFERLDAHAPAFAADDVFCCLGTTLRQAGSRAAFRRVDFDYVLAAARLCAQASAGHFLWISAVGASPASPAFYSRVKGELEAAIARLPLRRWTALRPSLLLGARAERRAGEAFAAAVARPLAPVFVGPLRRYRPIAADDVAAAMLALAHGAAPPAGLDVRSGGAR